MYFFMYFFLLNFIYFILPPLPSPVLTEIPGDQTNGGKDYHDEGDDNGDDYFEGEVGHVTF